EPERRGDRRRHHQYLPVRDLPAHPRGDPRRRGPARQRDELAMSRVAHVDRRAFLASVAAVGGSLALGFEIPFGPRTSHASIPAREITAWIVIEPDETVIIRVAKSEMGQGILRGGARRVGKGPDGDGKGVKAELAPPHENRGRDGVGGNMSTGASRSISASQNDLRRAGATARAMLIAAAAARWNVPDAE